MDSDEQRYYRQQNYDYSYDEPEGRRPRRRVRLALPAIFNRLGNPFYAGAALLVVGIALGGIILMGGGTDTGNGTIPVIKADMRPVREMPSQASGMEIPFRDSTVFDQAAALQADQRAPVENLLEPAPSAPDQAGQSEAGAQAESAVATQKPEKIHAPAASPETLAFVKSVLEQDGETAEPAASAAQAPPAAKPAPQEQAKKQEKASAAEIEPAAGAATSAPKAVKSGTSYVQLASITDQAQAVREWSKLQRSYPDQLSGLSYRVDRADLGDKGVFYRIQAGPISLESAQDICAAIKAQKPGACLVIK